MKFRGNLACNGVVLRICNDRPYMIAILSFLLEGSWENTDSLEEYKSSNPIANISLNVCIKYGFLAISKLQKSIQISGPLRL